MTWETLQLEPFLHFPTLPLNKQFSNTLLFVNTEYPMVINYHATPKRQTTLNEGLKEMVEMHSC